MTKNDSIRFKPFARHVSQLKIPDNHLYPAEIQTAICEALKAASNFSDKLFILENLLDAARDE